MRVVGHGVSRRVRRIWREELLLLLLLLLHEVKAAAQSTKMALLISPGPCLAGLCTEDLLAL
jgi:hypothetical protein